MEDHLYRRSGSPETFFVIEKLHEETSWRWSFRSLTTRFTISWGFLWRHGPCDKDQIKQPTRKSKDKDYPQNQCGGTWQRKFWNPEKNDSLADQTTEQVTLTPRSPNETARHNWEMKTLIFSIILPFTNEWKDSFQPTWEQKVKMSKSRKKDSSRLFSNWDNKE